MKEDEDAEDVHVVYSIFFQSIPLLMSLVGSFVLLDVFDCRFLFLVFCSLLFAHYEVVFVCLCFIYT